MSVVYVHRPLLVFELEKIVAFDYPFTDESTDLCVAEILAFLESVLRPFHVDLLVTLQLDGNIGLIDIVRTVKLSIEPDRSLGMFHRPFYEVLEVKIPVSTYHIHEDNDLFEPTYSTVTTTSHNSFSDEFFALPVTGILEKESPISLRQIV
ncbi:hypothetical protein [Haloarcula sp. JP-L23]|uniref:hypothetical protein n=1 Tax=Haloarcula sp. JP-L23 TaxID=2716717 RepID=UPI00140F0EF0|nr:hypothetical protein G9465_02560 [Haloarcula sp. JP-L23]